MRGGNNDLIIAVETARDAFYLDYPEVFYINMEKFTLRVTKDGSGKYHAYLGTGNTASYYTTGITDVADVNSKVEEYENALEVIVDNAKKFNSDENKTKQVKQIEYVHEQIIKSTKYKLDDVCTPKYRGYIRTPYGALVTHEAVCEGYSKAMKVALDQLGIPCILVRGVYKANSSDEGEGHMWNYVQLDGKWYAIDVTFDDTDKNDQYEKESIITDYFLAGEGFMSYGHYPDGIMSAPEFEFKYPKLEYYYYGSENVASIDGLDVVYSTTTGTTGDILSVFDISYKGMNFADAKEAGYHYLIKYYMDEKVDGWFYIDKLADMCQIIDSTNSFQLNFAKMDYIEIAITDVPMDDRANSSDTALSNKYQRYQGEDESEFLARSGVLECPDANYIAPPRFASAQPYIETKLKPGKKENIRITYDKTLKKTSDNVKPSCYITTKNAWTSSATTNSKIENFTWDGDKTVQFDFTPSDQYGDNSVIYYFNINGLVGTDSNKVPEPAYYYVQETFGCTYSMSQSGVWRVYGRPTLIDAGDINAEGWTLSDGTTISKDSELNKVTDRLALVVSETSSSQEKEMTNLINHTGEKILGSETYNINLILCNKKVLNTANGQKVTVYLGFPENYGPSDTGVTFKAYHFKTVNGQTVAEEIDCVVTPYGLLVTCDSFSPYAVVAVEKKETDTSKSIAINSSGNGLIIKKSDSKVYSQEEPDKDNSNKSTFVEGQSKTYTITAANGYQIDTVTIGNKEVTEAKGKDTADILIKYEDFMNENNILKVTFVAKTIAQKEIAKGETTVIQPIIVKEQEQEQPKEDKIDDIDITPYLFNSTYYADMYPDLKAVFGNNEIALKNHYYNYGIKEGRQASPIFDPIYYLNKYSDLKNAYKNNYQEAYNHFAYIGIKEGRQASSYFSARYYMDHNVDVKNAYKNNNTYAVLHFACFGIPEGRIASSEFNIINYYNQCSGYVKNQLKKNYIKYYTLAQGASIIEETKVDITPYMFDADLYYYLYEDLQKGIGYYPEALKNHYYTYGIKEGRTASYVFDVNYYLKEYSDLKVAYKDDYQSAYYHFIQSGINEGRKGNQFFDVTYYLNHYEDLKNAFGTNYSKALEHFVCCGMNEARVASKDFNVNNYKKNYKDLSNAFSNNWKLYFRHYVISGQKEGRKGV